MHKRSLATYASAPFQKRHYTAVANIFARAHNPVDFLSRYMLRGGEYPTTLSVRTPAEPRLAIQIYSGEDVQTINEIFCRGDYKVDGSEAVVVDFGSNIGISALYWLHHAPRAFVYLYEPLPMNIERLRKQLTGLESRFELNEVAVGLSNGEVAFGHEPSGRYGGIGRAHMPTITVPCIDSNAELARIVDKHGAIDVLKIDIETMEKVVTERIPTETAARIRTLFVEYPFTSNPLAGTHEAAVSGDVTLFSRRGG
jgi:FkbM family methyltransferase